MDAAPGLATVVDALVPGAVVSLEGDAAGVELAAGLGAGLAGRKRKKMVKRMFEDFAKENVPSRTCSWCSSSNRLSENRGSSNRGRGNSSSRLLGRGSSG